MIRSTLGFVYTPQLNKVLLIKKQKPVDHKDKLNGLGGKCEGKESYRNCLSREVLEECGLSLLPTSWKKIGSIKWAEWHVEVFATIFDGSPQTNHIMIANEVAWYSVKNIPKNVIENLQWLIPVGIDSLTNKTPPKLKVNYPD
jgi:8-oxo-dGTP diphosphatase